MQTILVWQCSQGCFFYCSIGALFNISRVFSRALFHLTCGDFHHFESFLRVVLFYYSQLFQVFCLPVGANLKAGFRCRLHLRRYVARPSNLISSSSKGGAVEASVPGAVETAIAGTVEPSWLAVKRFPPNSQAHRLQLGHALHLVHSP